jgi:hypothetical protein
MAAWCMRYLVDFAYGDRRIRRLRACHDSPPCSTPPALSGHYACCAAYRQLGQLLRQLLR